MTTIVWFRQDLRRDDNPALAAAASQGPVLPLYILDDVNTGKRWRMGAASRWWLHHSLKSLRADLGGLTLLRGNPIEILPGLAKTVGATRVVWNRCYEPFAVARDTAVKSSLRAAGINAESYCGNLLFEPWEIANKDGGPFRVYTPFWRACLARFLPPPISALSKKPELVARDCELLEDLDLLPTKPNWAAGWEKLWQPGERGALARLQDFRERKLANYEALRDRPDAPGTSLLSPHLHFGEISVRSLWRALDDADRSSSKRQSVQKFRSELGWREFSHHLLYHFPSLPEKNWRSRFDAYPWQDNPAALSAWQSGQTGYPIVDAGMRELWKTGWMHNRVRMIAASFLIKHLRIDWQRGENWFWETLLDADLANNAAGWQWVAGSGADAAPYFRIFNPVLQGKKFDPAGTYVRKWCPELARLPDRLIHTPVEAEKGELLAAGVELGRNYPMPIVDHHTARQAALDSYATLAEASISS
jgi:deoxyribodipyrimidine photo-lyase